MDCLTRQNRHTRNQSTTPDDTSSSSTKITVQPSWKSTEPKQSHSHASAKAGWKTSHTDSRNFWGKHDRRHILADRQIVVEEEILNKEEAARFLKIGIDNFTKLYKTCADRQGGKTVTYKKSVILDRYDALCNR
nr:MAG TPA: hypothetical protein [Caudoviricetes sp.]